MAKKSLWQGLKDFFKDDGPHLITDEEWEAMQAAQGAGEAPEEDAEPLSEYWRCPECRNANPAALLFCSRCGYHPGGFADILPRMTDEQIELVLHGSCRYPADQLRLLEKELARRQKPAAAAADLPPVQELDAAELQRLAAQYQDSPAEVLYETLADADYTPEARRAAADELARRGLPADPAAPAAEAAPETAAGWKCTRCGTENPQEEYFCTSCGDYRY